MKVAGYRVVLPSRCIRGLTLCLCILLVLPAPVFGDLASATLTQIYFTKDGLPYTGSVSYTVNCYHNATPAAAGPGKAPPVLQVEKVFSYSATCPGYGCRIYNSYYKIESRHIEWCDLEGETDGKKFSIREFSSLPYNGSCDYLPTGYHRWLNFSDPRDVYYMTDEYFACIRYDLNRNQSGTIFHRFYDACNLTTDPLCFTGFSPDGTPLMNRYGFETVRNRTKLGFEQYRQYLETCDPVTDPDCPGIILAGRPLKKFPGLHPAVNASMLRREPCLPLLVRINSSLIMTEEQQDQIGDGALAFPYIARMCESRWTIPSENVSPKGTTLNTYPPYTPQSPVEYMYCSILQFFGGRC